MQRHEASVRPAWGIQRARLRRAFRHALFGGVAGYAVLHPVVMIIFRSLQGGETSLPAGTLVLRSAAEAFEPHMLPMAAVFALLTAGVGAVDGWLRGLVLEQRRDLSQLVERLQREGRELARLHAMHRRATRFLVHDLKTHIGCIRGFAELLLTSPAVAADPESSDAAERISRQARKLMDAVHDLLDLARLDEAPRPEPRPVPLEGLFHEIEETFAAAVRDGKLRISRPDDGTPAVLGDRRLVLRVLYNLIANALDHGAGDLPVEFAAHPAAQPGWIELSCTDQGPGIPDEELPLVFEEFHSRGGSSGLGLAFCRAAIDALGGTISCETRPPRGCTFTVRLPASNIAQEDRDE